MLREIKQVLRLVMCLKKHRQRGLKATGGLWVLLWTDAGAFGQSLNCSVAAAGLWCEGFQLEELQPDLKEIMFPCLQSCPPPDIEELHAFTELHGPLRFLLSFQTKDASYFSPEGFARIEEFLHTFSLAKAGINIRLKFKLDQETIQREFRVKMKKKISWAAQSVNLDVFCRRQPPECVKKGRWCWGGHPVRGGQILLNMPPEAMNQGLFGDLSMQLVTLLSPCVLQYPHLPTRLSHIQVLVYSPRHIPVTGHSTFFQNLPAHLDYQDLGLQGLHCSSFKDLVHNGGFVYDVKQENSEDPEQESNLPKVQQNLLLLLFLQHSDPFTCQLSDIMASEALIEHHLEDILSNNRRVVTAALQTELKNSLKEQKRRTKKEERLRSAVDVILSSVLTIVSCSSNEGFRHSCLNCMEVCDTRDLSASLRESLSRVTSWKFVPRGGCYSDQRERQLETDESTRREI